jgi:pimeloyl-ACP methyl ester carboxylesterase
MALTLRHWLFVLPTFTLLAAPACGGDGATSTDSNGTTGSTTEPGTTEADTSLATSNLTPGDMSITAPTTTAEPDTTSEPQTTEGTDGTDGTTTDPGTTTEDTEGTTSPDDTTTTGPVEPGPADIPELPDVPELSSARFTKIPLGQGDAPQGYWEYLPPGYGGGDKYPLLVALHGIGENGNGDDKDLDKLLVTGIPQIIKNDKWDNDRPFVVLTPQHPGGGCPSANEVHTFLDYAIGHYDINPARVYLTGLSCGAIGSWSYLAEHLDSQIAAMVPIAGDGKTAFNKAKCELGRIPIWAFHGDADSTVNVSGTTDPLNNLMMCDPKPDVDMVIYPGVGHNSWQRTYDLSAGHDIYAWFLQYYKQ